jgi:hypothetical protein
LIMDIGVGKDSFNMSAIWGAFFHYSLIVVGFYHFMFRIYKFMWIDLWVVMPFVIIYLIIAAFIAWSTQTNVDMMYLLNSWYSPIIGFLIIFCMFFDLFILFKYTPKISICRSSEFKVFVHASHKS